MQYSFVPKITFCYSTTVDNLNYHKLIIFDTADQFEMWKTLDACLKRAMVAITAAFRDGDDVNSHMAKLEGWLDMFADYAKQFGDARVPLDVRNTVHSVQNCLKIPNTAFGPDTRLVAEPPKSIPAANRIDYSLPTGTAPRQIVLPNTATKPAEELRYSICCTPYDDDEIQSKTYFKMMDFDSEEHFIQYKKMHTRIRRKSSRMPIDADRANEDPDKPYRLMAEWLHLTSEFLHLFGHARIPRDLREEINWTQHILELPQTHFGPDTGVLSALPTGSLHII